MINVAEINKILRKLCGGRWFGDRHQPTITVGFYEYEIVLEDAEIKDKSDEEIKGFINQLRIKKLKEILSGLENGEAA